MLFIWKGGKKSGRKSRRGGCFHVWKKKGRFCADLNLKRWVLWKDRISGFENQIRGDFLQKKIEAQNLGVVLHVNPLEPLKKEGRLLFWERRADSFGRSRAKKTVLFEVLGIHV